MLQVLGVIPDNSALVKSTSVDHVQIMCKSAQATTEPLRKQFQKAQLVDDCMRFCYPYVRACHGLS